MDLWKRMWMELFAQILRNEWDAGGGIRVWQGVCFEGCFYGDK